VTYLLAGIAILALLWLLSHYTVWRAPRPWDLPRVLMYHSVEPGEATGMNVPPKRFEAQLRYLRKRGFRSLTLSELAQTPDHHKAVVITFDDGFRNNYTHAWPLLQQYGFRSTIFLSPEIEGIETLQREQIREMADSGAVEFGAHTLHHVNLTRSDADAARKEIDESIAWVEKISGKPCTSFAYPYGRYGPEHIGMLKQAGIDLAVTVKKAIRPLQKRLEIPRLSVSGKANLLQFHLIMSRGRYRV